MKYEFSAVDNRPPKGRHIEREASPSATAATMNWLCCCRGESRAKTKEIIVRPARRLSITNVVSEIANKTDTEGKQAFKQARSLFQQNPAAAAAATRWEQGTISGKEAMAEVQQWYQEQEQEAQANGMTWQAKPNLVGMRIGTFLADPIFTHFYESTANPRPDIIFYEDDEMIIFPNNKSPLRAVDGEAAAMSYVHMLAVPKQRIYNSVSLKLEHVEVLQALAQKGSEILSSDVVHDYYLRTRGLELSPPILDARFMDFYVHLHPMHSVGQLHIHCCLKNLWTENGDLLMYKNTRLADVIEVLREESWLPPVQPNSIMPKLPGVVAPHVDM